jgi:hypothetical protein
MASRIIVPLDNYGQFLQSRLRQRSDLLVITRTCDQAACSSKSFSQYEQELLHLNQAVVRAC